MREERERERERDIYKYDCSLVNPIWNILFRILLYFQKKDKYGRVQRFLVGSPTIFIWLFYQTHSALSLSFSLSLSLSLSISLFFVPGGVSQVLRRVAESVLSHNSALYYVYKHILGVK